MIDFENIGKIKGKEVMKDIIEIGVIRGLDRMKEIDSTSDDTYKDVITSHIIIVLEKYIKFNEDKD